MPCAKCDIMNIVLMVGGPTHSDANGGAGVTDAQKPLDIYLSRLKIIVEIFAIFAAGYWAFTRFGIEEKPSLAPRFDVRSSLEWYAISDEKCRVQYSLVFRNIGKTSITIGPPTGSVWISDDWTREDRIKYLDEQFIKDNGKRELTIDRFHNLATHYPPGTDDNININFELANDPKKIVLFEILFPVLKGYKSEKKWDDYQWDRICGEQKKALSP